MTTNEIRAKFLAFFEKRGHAIIPSAPLVPENDPSVLFNTAGMQPLVPYLLGQPHPHGKRLVDAQKCVRTVDIDEIGDNTHVTFFEMLGNWSLGDYLKEDAITWSYNFLTSPDEGLGLDPKRLYVTVFEGDKTAPRDEEAFETWKRFLPENRIYFMGADTNWWSPGENGPCGPDSEMFYDVSEEGLGDMSKEEFIAADKRQDVVEVWNDVFMEYEKKDGVVVGKLAQKNVDTGAGLERTAMVVQGKKNIFDTDIFSQLNTTMLAEVNNVDLSPELIKKARRVVADHVRTAAFLISDGVVPSNTDQGYILRRLLRRAIRYADQLGLPGGFLAVLASMVVEQYKDVYPNIKEGEEKIVSEITKEETKFRRTLARGMKEFSKLKNSDIISGHDAFILFSTYGFPLELTLELAGEHNISVDEDGFREEMKKHQALSRAGAGQKFKGGLADHSEKTTMLHTCTHLMLAGLRKYLGNDVHQAGSNITEERTRFDFTYPQKVERDVLDKVEAYVNEAIEKKCDVVIEKMQKEDARAAGVEGSFWEKYPDLVNVYTVRCGDTIYSQELCGGPHVENTATIAGTFTITKEKASSAGVRRIKATLT